MVYLLSRSLLFCNSLKPGVVNASLFLMSTCKVEIYEYYSFIQFSDMLWFLLEFLRAPMLMHDFDLRGLILSLRNISDLN